MFFLGSIYSLHLKTTFKTFSCSDFISLTQKRACTVDASTRADQIHADQIHAVLPYYRREKAPNHYSLLDKILRGIVSKRMRLNGRAIQDLEPVHKLNFATNEVVEEVLDHLSRCCLLKESIGQAYWEKSC